MDGIFVIFAGAGLRGVAVCGIGGDYDVVFAGESDYQLAVIVPEDRGVAIVPPFAVIVLERFYVAWPRVAVVVQV